MVGFLLYTQQRKRSRSGRCLYGLERAEKSKRRLPYCHQFPLLLFLLLSGFEANAYLTPLSRIPSLCSLQRQYFDWRKKQSVSRLILWDTESSTGAAVTTNNILDLTFSSSSSSNNTFSSSSPPRRNGQSTPIASTTTTTTTTVTPTETTANGATQPQTQQNVPPPLDLMNSNTSSKVDDDDDDDEDDDDDVPHLTPNGGYTHTKESKAKISAANKGKTPWNKGKKRSDEEKARIAEGVRRKNRERFLQKLADMGMTEEEYEAQERKKAKQREAEKRARRTENGGYRPTEATKEKISKVLKEKYATGDIPKRKVDPAKVRRGFTHSKETRQKIAESMRKKWAVDTTYRERMMKASAGNTNPDIRQKISETLRQKWLDPEFRERMMEKIANRKFTLSGPHAQAHREKISAAMKAKWQDEEYRKKTLESIVKRKAATAATANRKKLATTIATTMRQKATPIKKTTVSSARRSSSTAGGPRMPHPIAEVPPKQSIPKKQTTGKKKVIKKQKTVTTQHKSPKTPSSLSKLKGVARILDDDYDIEDENRKMSGLDGSMVVNGESSSSSNKEKDEKGKHGSVSQLREERRDLYDLLYGDDEDSGARFSSFASISALGDENLDNFDPYGLEDF